MKGHTFQRALFWFMRFSGIIKPGGPPINTFSFSSSSYSASTSTRFWRYSTIKCLVCNLGITQLMNTATYILQGDKLILASFFPPPPPPPPPGLICIIGANGLASVHQYDIYGLRHGGHKNKRHRGMSFKDMLYISACVRAYRNGYANESLAHY